ncbi:Nif3-like dinuclear metal center hexameric protein [Thermoanaerobacterium sp. RBIITD]|uniref:Nif3-like dinuclear metal center hexameric protein n=1 Tax=Thermoanaerobacterium sp. RBIITD TaxID=1550240 RepID=UPI000BB6C650|nr:Nif3-like dinuclear metal center hexameric protein [Thermoanaerobacterium sp. RBIITD]SNX54931.1 dinuclear metal center protein, YbgI/SA1388 family [Thermoanaerobacterium sp. RBIITD]
MSLKCQTIAGMIDKLAPHKYAEDWDNVGLLIGNPQKDVSTVMVALDATYEVIKEAISKKVDMIVTHHPIIFKPVKNIRDDNPTGKIISLLMKNDIPVYSAHTNFDIAKGGMNDILCNVLGIYNEEVLQVTYKEEYKKIVVYVPSGYEDIVKTAMCNAGAGFIGNYSNCTFQTSGMGSFKPLEGTNPFIGEIGKIENTQEIRIETITPGKLVNRVINAMLKVHPYEEVAYDIYPVENGYDEYGLGRIGYIKGTTLKELAEQVKAKFKLPALRIVGDLAKTVNKVAICGGSGGSLISISSFKGADVLITGDIGYHDAIDATHLGLSIIDAGHFGTEKISVNFIAEYIIDEAQKMNIDLNVIISETQKDPFKYL